MTEVTATQDTFVTKIIEWPIPENWGTVGSDLPRAQKAKVRATLTQHTKQSVLAEIYGMSGVEVVNELPGTLQALVATDQVTWNNLQDPKTGLLPMNKITVHEPAQVCVTEPIRN